MSLYCSGLPLACIEWALGKVFPPKIERGWTPYRDPDSQDAFARELREDGIGATRRKTYRDALHRHDVEDECEDIT